MRAPLQGRREEARRLAARLRDLARGAPERPSPAAPDRAEDAAARLDAARRRLRSSITPPEDEDSDGDR